MKNLITMVMVFTSTFMFAQDFEISEAPRALENGTYNSYLFELPDVDKETAEDQWKKFMKDYKSKSKYSKKTKFWMAEDAKIGGLSDDPVNVVAKIIEDNNPKKRTSVIVWFELSDRTYLNSELDSVRSSHAVDILTKYAMSTSKTNSMAIVKEQEKLLTSLQKDLKKLEKENKEFNSEIEKAKKSIAQNEKNIEINESDQRNKKKEIEAQIKAVGAAKAVANKFN